MDNQRQIKDLLRRMGRVEVKSSGAIYAQGTYTPTYTGATTAGATTYTVQQGWYWIVGTGAGAICFVTGLVVWTAATGTGDAQISLPFAPSSTIGFRASGSLRVTSVTFTTTTPEIIVNAGAAKFTMESPVSNAAGNVVQMEAAGNITFSLFYGIDASGNPGTGSPSSPLTIEEIDGSPLVTGVNTIKVSNGTLTDNGGGSVTITTGGGGSGTVTSVDMTVPSDLSVSGNPITTSGTLAITRNNQSANKVFAGPTSGGAATPTFRSLVLADINTISAPIDADYWVETANSQLTTEVVVGTTGITRAAYASRQAAAKAGRLYFPSDSFYIQRDNGSSWDAYGSIFPMTEPVSGDFAWINQGGATISTTNGGVFLSIGSASGSNLRIRKKAAPSTPYHIILSFIPLITVTSSPLVGFVWRQSSDGKCITYHYTNNGGGDQHYGITKWTNVTTISANYVGNTAANQFFGRAVFFRIGDDGTNRTCDVSRDKQNWLNLHSVGRTDFMTADEVGYFVTNGTGTSSAAMTLIGWEETA